MFSHISVSAREYFALLGHLSLPPKFRFPAAKAETPRDRFAFEKRRVRQRRDVGVLLAQDQTSVEIGIENL